MTEALDWAIRPTRTAVRAAIATTWSIPEEAAAGITLPTFTSGSSTSPAIEELAALAVEFGVLDAEPDFDTPDPAAVAGMRDATGIDPRACPARHPAAPHADSIGRSHGRR